MLFGTLFIGENVPSSENWDYQNRHHNRGKKYTSTTHRRTIRVDTIPNEVGVVKDVINNLIRVSHRRTISVDTIPNEVGVVKDVINKLTVAQPPTHDVEVHSKGEPNGTEDHEDERQHEHDACVGKNMGFYYCYGVIQMTRFGFWSGNVF